MSGLVDYPLVIFVVSFFVLWLSNWIGTAILKRQLAFNPEGHEGFGHVVTATLTLLALIIGFSFSMAISRYDQRKIYEEEEANAIGTEYLRADLLPQADAVKVRALIKDYLDQRILFYTTRDEQRLLQINATTARLQAGLWSAVSALAAAQATPIIALTVAGMNDVLNTQGYTQAAWTNRIPAGAWALMAAMAICGNLLIGYGAGSAKAERVLLVVLPLVLSISFFLIADIDSPRRGIIRVNPQNLLSLAETLRAP